MHGRFSAARTSAKLKKSALPQIRCLSRSPASSMLCSDVVESLSLGIKEHCDEVPDRAGCQPQHLRRACSRR